MSVGNRTTGWTPPSDEETKRRGADYTTDIDVGVDDWQLYWEQVERTLKEVFDTPHPAGNDKLQRLKAKVEESENRSFATALFHLDPFQVAADLVEAGPVTNEQKRNYIEMLTNNPSNSTKRGYSLALLDEMKANTIFADVPDEPMRRTGSA